MKKEAILHAEEQLRKDGYIKEADMLHELAVELKVMTRAYEELYEKVYPKQPVPIYAHIKQVK